MSDQEERARARLALIASAEALADDDLELDDLADPDARSVAIRAEHARSMAGQIYATLHSDKPYDLAQHVAALRALPASWERERAQRSTEPSRRPRGASRKRRR